MNPNYYCLQRMVFGNHPRGIDNCRVCKPAKIQRQYGAGEYLYISDPNVAQQIQLMNENDEFLEKIYPKYQDCPCCKGLVYDCKNKDCAQMGQCWCKSKDEAQINQ